MMLIKIEKKASKSLTMQIFEQIKVKILNKEFQVEFRLPSSRDLATTLGISRNVVLEAYEQLAAEGYLIVKPRSGTFVAPGSSFEKKKEHLVSIVQSIDSNKGEAYIDFKAGNPAMDHFPRKTWGRLAKEVCNDAPQSIFGYSSSQGISELRQVLAHYLLRTRGVRCHPNQIVITSGATQALSLLTELLVKKDSYVAVEDPVTDEMRNIFTVGDRKIHPIPVDDYGIKPEHLSSSEKPSFVFVIPSHQFPLGGTLPIQRRIQLIEYTRKMNCYLVEDDYDSEFTYEGSPVHSLQGLDSERVIYVGTFSKILSPSLRIGYVVLPINLVESFCQLRWYKDRHSSTLEQMILARFIEEGYFERHVRHMKKIYYKRRKALVESLKFHFSHFKIVGQAAGMHLVVEFENVFFTDLLQERLIENGVVVYPVEKYAMEKGLHIQKVVMGYGSLTEEQIKEGVKRLKKAIIDSK